MRLTEDTLVSLRLVDEISSVIQSLEASALENSASSAKEEDICEEHKLAKRYYCETCHVCCCSDCVVMGEEHRGHVVKKVEMVAEDQISAIQLEMHAINARLSECRLAEDAINDNLEAVTRAKDEGMEDIEKATMHMIERLDSQMKDKLSILNKRREYLRQEIQRLESIRFSITEAVQRLPLSSLITQAEELKTCAKEAQIHPAEDLSYDSVPTEFISEVHPPWAGAYFTLPKFSGYLATVTGDLESATASPAAASSPSPKPGYSTQAQGLSGLGEGIGGGVGGGIGAGSTTRLTVYSEPLLVHGQVWRLKVYPRGSGVAEGTHLSVFLELCDGCPEAASYEYSVEMIHQDDKTRNVKREFVSLFKNGECWGYNRFFALTACVSEGFLTEQDAIIFKFRVRAPTFGHYCLDQERYIRHLQTKNKELRRKCQQYEQSDMFPVTGRSVEKNAAPGNGGVATEFSLSPDTVPSSQSWSGRISTARTLRQSAKATKVAEATKTTKTEVEGEGKVTVEAETGIETDSEPESDEGEVADRLREATAKYGHIVPLMDDDESHIAAMVDEIQEDILLSCEEDTSP
jgi:tripartite motif-containing protein 37